MADELVGLVGLGLILCLIGIPRTQIDLGRSARSLARNSRSCLRSTRSGTLELHVVGRLQFGNRCLQCLGFMINGRQQLAGALVDSHATVSLEGLFIQELITGSHKPGPRIGTMDLLPCLGAHCLGVGIHGHRELGFVVTGKLRDTRQELLSLSLLTSVDGLSHAGLVVLNT